MLLFCSLLPLTIGLTLGQQPKQSPFANYSPRRAFEQAIFEPATVFESSIGDNQFLNGQQYQYFHAFQSSIIEPRSSEDSSSIVQPAAGEKLEQPLVQYNTAGTGHHGSSSYTQLHHQQPVASHQTSHQASHQSNSQASHQASHQTSHQTSHQASHQTNHQSNPQVNHQISHQANHQANHQVNHPTAHQASQQFDRFHHYDLEPTVYHANNPHPSNPQANNLQSLPSARHQQSAVYSTTPVPILRLKNTKIDGKLSPTLIITLPKKRKSNGKTRRFPFLKAIVSSFISTDRRTSEQNKNHQQQQSFKSSQQQQIQAANSVSSKLELPNNPNEYAASAHAARPKQQQQQNQHQHLAAGSTGNAQVAQLRSQTSMADANSNGNTNANMANGNVNSNGNSNTNSNANMVNSSPAQADNPSNSGNSNNNNPSAAGQNPNSNLNSNLNQNSNPNSNQNLNQNLNPTANQNANNANLPKEDAGKLMDAPFEPDAFPAKDELEDEDEDEFNEWSDAPRPHNFDDNSYYIESNKIKYSSVGGQEPIKQPLGDHQSSQSSYASVSQQGNIPQKKPAVVSSSSSSSSSYNANQYTSTSSPPDFESMTSEVIDQEENDNSEKRPSISVRSRGSFLISVLSRMMKSTNFTMITEDMRLGSSSRASCLACHALAALYLSPFYSKDAMVNAARTICISFRLQPPRVCTGLIDSFKDDLDYIRTHTKLNRREMCGVIFGLKCSRITTNNLNWIIQIPHRPNMIERRMMKHNLNSINLEASESGSVSSGTPFNANYTLYHTPAGQPATGSSPKNYNLAAASNSNLLSSANSLLDVVQITDIHVDPYYVPGSSAECGEPLCCRATSGPVKGPGKSAGVWGDYRNCDTPINTLRNTLKQISESHPNAQYWMWTGDIAPHDIWNITRGEIVYQLRLVSNMIKEYSKVPVFPVIGNHEGVPVNSFPPPEVQGDLSVSWLYDEVAKQWGYWLPPEAIKTLRFGGYYTVKIKPGFRIVSLNTNYCTRLNPWTLYDPVDPGNQLKWLVKELHSAELANDKVHILGHIPPDNRECTQAWLNNFLRIIDRFEHVVLAQYYGHTHRDEFRVLYSPYGHGLRPISVAYIGPSVTPFTENNPAYRVYSMNDKGYIQDHHTYYFNLTEANHGELGIPIWRHEYSATQAFPLKNLGPEGWHELISRFMEDNRLLNKYHKQYFRYSATRYNQICLGKCRQALINDLIVAHPLHTKPRRLFGSRKTN